MPLVRYNVRSVLRNINLADIEEIKEMMDSIARCLDTTAGAEAKRIAEKALLVVDSGPIFRIIQAIEHNPEWPLLRMAIERLLKTRNRGRLEILGAVSELEHLAEEKVLISPTAYAKEYSEALEDFLDLPPLPFSQGSQASEEGEANLGPETSSPKNRVTSSISEQSKPDGLVAISKTGGGKSMSSNVEKKVAGEKRKSIAPSQNIVKPAPRKPLPDLPESKVVSLKANPTTPRRKKRSAPVSDEYAVSSPAKSSSISPKRGKSLKACDECRRRKTKCLRDEGNEKCNSCVKMSRDCVLSAASPPKSATKGSILGAALDKKTKTEEPVEDSKSEMKNILHHFDDLKEGKAFGIVAEADEKNSNDDVDEVSAATPEVIAAQSDAEDYDYNPSKRICRPGKKSSSKSVRKASSITAE
ncbi:hypothetical protein VTL71DRAFT_4498 [Oculimacula yallundae]|uniref:Zn(2)-C6 fungal-type domain-containing protein n=1 Tax=Oculimacula yallundae TaxID=86028 RepID=A0ABR4C264_9HELO